MIRFELSHFDVNGSAVYSASHEIWNCVSITLPAGYFDTWPPAINVSDFNVTAAT
jgi:hypothetical protein